MDLRGNDITLRHMTSRRSHVFKTGYQRFERPIYDFGSKYAPCRAGCPAGHDIAWALYLAGKGRFDLALEAFREDSPFPAITGRVCYHPCERSCNRSEHDQPIAINALERALADYGNEHAIAPLRRLHEESVGVVGTGPAGLACAYHLVRLGYAVTVYDANDVPGGVLAYGIPAYRLPRGVVATEVEALRTLGVAFRCGTRVGVDISFGELQEAHHALFLAPGMGHARGLSIPVPDDARVQSGVAFLRAVSTGSARGLSGHVAVIGGGDVAVDAARSALRLGAARVTILCVETRAQMPAHPEEVAAARHEGIEILDRVAPRQLEAGPGLRLVVGNVASAQAGDIQFAEGPVTVLLLSHLIYAVGQEADLSFLPGPLAGERRLPVDRWGRTALAGVFAGGDITGSYNVVNAIGSAKRAAIGIDAFLRGHSLEGVEEQIRVGTAGAVSMRAYAVVRRGEAVTPAAREVHLRDINLDYFPLAERAVAGEVGPRARIGSFVEVSVPLSRAEAAAEAQRCFHCGTCDMCGNCFTFCPDASVIRNDAWGFHIDLDHCKGCAVCVQECPRSAMSMIPEGKAGDEDRNG